MRKIIPLTLLLVFLSIPGLYAVDTADTRMLTQPAVSNTHICFSYAEDLWVADIDGKNVRRLTTHEGAETNPHFSPDGKWIAFSGDYDGNVDVFAVPVEGGVPRRLTWHPGDDTARGFTPDGKVMFISERFAVYTRLTQLFTVPLGGGYPTRLPLHRVTKAAFSPDGKYLVYNPLREAFLQWKNYRGGRVGHLWIYDFKTKEIEKIPQPKGRCNDTDPMWIGSNVYFRSDRDGEFNLYLYDPKIKAVKQLTDYKEFPILSTGAGNGKIIFEQAGYLHIFDTAAEKATRLKIGVAADLKDLRKRYVKSPRFFANNGGISPTGKRAVVQYRGDILTIPAKKGDVRNLTNSPGAHDRDPAWSPDGKSIAFFSDASGEYQLHIRPQDGKGKEKTYKVKGHGFYSLPVWSPDSKKIAYYDNSRASYWIDIKTGVNKKIAADDVYGPTPLYNNRITWSPDSRWIAYTLTNRVWFRGVYLYSIDKDKSYPVSDDLSEASEPVFDASGKYLYFFASTDSGPVNHWFALSRMDMRSSNSIYMAVLDKSLPNPLAKESDEEAAEEKKASKTGKSGKNNKGKNNKGKNNEGKENGKSKAKSKPTVIHVDGIHMRILSLPVPVGNYSNLRAGKAGNIYYLAAPGRFSGARGSDLNMFDLKKRKHSTIMKGVNDYYISADNKKILYRKGRTAAITNLGPKLKPGDGMLNLSAVSVRVDPLKEWPQVFYEVWRINRDFFYDPNYHGADWNAMKKRYQAFLPHLSCRGDLNRLCRWLCSELSVGHSGGGYGDFNRTIDRIPGGLLGADYAVENGRYRFKRVFGGLNWNPGLRSPLTEPGVNVKTGEYLLEVNGKKVLPPDNLFRHFEATAGKIVELKVGPNADGSGARVVKVTPVSSETRLRERAWVERNVKMVEKATNGRVAYVHVPDTSFRGHRRFKRYFFPQSGKDGIIIDERYNRGGSVADYYIDILKRPYVCSWATRYGKDIHTPSASIQGPKVMLVNEYAGSGGDLLPWMFRKFKLGTMVGTRTWGGLVGILGYPRLIDGGVFTSPNIGFWHEEEGFSVENEGVPPDVEVEEFPKDMLNGRDPQLEKAIEIIKKQLKQHPPKKHKRPSFPIRVKKDK